LKTRLEKSGLLDGGGKPTVRELLASLVFNPVDRTIRINGERIVMQRATVGIELRRELIRLLGSQEARIFLLRLGFLSGRADARFLRTSWPRLDIGDAFTAGTRLHMFSGVVRVETVYNEFDFRKKRFAGEFNWYDSIEAAEFGRLHRQATEPVCWTQLGYASGYASEFFDTLIVYKEAQCSAEGHTHCRVVGKPADVWGPGDPEVILFRERIAAQSEERPAERRRALNVRRAEAALGELDRAILAPVRVQLDRMASMALPVLITGAPGTGRSRAARYLHRAAGGTVADFRHVDGSEVTPETCAEIATSGRNRRRGEAGAAIMIDGIERVPPELHQRLAGAIEKAVVMGGPPVFALSGLDASSAGTSLPPELWYALSALTAQMPAFSERPGDCLGIARALLPAIATRMNLPVPKLDAGAARAIEQASWPGNLRQMRSVLSALLATHRHDGPVTRGAFEAQYDRLAHADSLTAGARRPDVRAWLDRELDGENFSITHLEREAYEAAVARTKGNLSAAARLLGLTRAQLAYRLAATNPAE